MDGFLKAIIVIVLLSIIGICAIILSISITKKKQLKKMDDDVHSVLEKIVYSSNDEYFLKKEENNVYDYTLDTPTTTFYIKIVPNLSNEEICVNNSVKWQLRKSFNDESLRFVNDIEGLMRLDIESNKIIKKVFLVYPNTRSLLKYINECEMVFIYPKTDVYGSNIITYRQLEENPDLLKSLQEEI